MWSIRSTASRAYSAGGKARSEPLPHFWVGNEIHLSSEGKNRQPSSAPPPETSSATAPARQEAAQPVTMLTLLLAAACTLLLGYLLGGMKTSAEQLRNEIGAVDFFCSVKGLRPGMREKLGAISDGLKAAVQRADSLATEHIAMIPESKNTAKDSASKDTGKDQDPKEEKRKQWVEVLTLLAAARAAVDQVNNTYGLTPEETAEVERLIDEKKKAELMGVPDSSSSGAKPSGSQAPPKASGEKPPPPKPSGGKPPAAAH